MNVAFELKDDKALITILPEAKSQDFDYVFEELYKIENLREIRVDLKWMYHIKSEIVAQLIEFKKVSRKKFCKTTLLNVPEGVAHILQVTNLINLFHIEKDFSTYDSLELLEMLHNPENTDEVSNYIVAHYDNFRDLIMEKIMEDDANISEHAITIIGRVQDSSAIRALRRALDSKHNHLKKAAILALGWLGDEQSKDKFFEFIQSDDKELSEAAGASLALLSDESDMDRFRALSTSPNSNLRSTVADILSIINGEKAYKIIKEMLLSETDHKITIKLVRKIAFFNMPDATKVLISMLDDPSMETQEAAAAGLIRTGIKDSEEALLKKVKSEDIWVSYFAVKALARECSAKGIYYLMDYYENAADNVKLAILETIGNSDVKIDDFLVERLKEDNEDIRKEALTTLHKFNNTKGLAYAIELATKDPSWIVRYRAIEIIEKDEPEDLCDILSSINFDNKYIQDKISLILGEQC